MKKVISYLITVIMVFTMIPSMVFAGIAEGQQLSVSKNVLEMKYDDHMDLTGKTVEIIDSGSPESYQVGYGIPKGLKDSAVVTLENDTLVATGTGKARISIDGATYEVNVTAAPISVLLLIGQSNMEGIEGSYDQSIVCEAGQVYSTYGSYWAMNASNASYFAASALTGDKSKINVHGTTSCLREHPIFSLTEAGTGKWGMDSGLAYQWNKETGEKVWVINAAQSGAPIDRWQQDGDDYVEAKSLFNACMDTLKKEVEAGHFTLSHIGYYWCQGCADSRQSAKWYVKKYLAMHQNLKEELAYDENRTFEFGGIIPIHIGTGQAAGYRSNPYTDVALTPDYENFYALEMVGPRAAQFWMANNPELEDIYITCTIGDDWLTMPDGTNGVADYFVSHYEGGRVDYPTQTAQSEQWRTPTTSADVKDSIHYNQIGYNELGRECARNTMYILGYKEKTKIPKVTYYDWTGYKTVEVMDAVTRPSRGPLVVPVVTPCYMSKDVTYNTSEQLSYNYYDLTGGACHGGSLTASTGETVKVNPTMENTLISIPGKPGGCNDGGYSDGVKCSVCDEWVVEPTYYEAPVHNYSSKYTVCVPATMDNEGYKAISCVDCGAVEADKVVIPRIKKVTVTNLVYNGSARTPEPNVVNYAKNTKLTNGVDYTVVYKDANAENIVKPKNVGAYTAVITFQGDYEGTIDCAFKINPKATTLNKVTSPAKKQIKVTWKKQAWHVTGYEIRYSSKANMAGSKTLKVTSYKTNTKTIKNLNAKKKYYVQIRTYKTVNGKDYRSTWSKAKTVTTK